MKPAAEVSNPGVSTLCGLHCSHIVAFNPRRDATSEEWMKGGAVRLARKHPRQYRLSWDEGGEIDNNEDDSFQEEDNDSGDSSSFGEKRH
ncbi:hypothetical protein J6590_029610 [Homalodisca vitripennis]|nr:hypothetical protein J6590_029610 [Homalodisca vitripennis]